MQKGVLVTADPELLDLTTVRTGAFGCKPTFREMYIAVGHLYGVLASSDAADTILWVYPVAEPEDIRMCEPLAHRSMAGEGVDGRTIIR